MSENDFVTREEAMQILGMRATLFDRLIKEKGVDRYKREGSRRRYFMRADIEDIQRLRAEKPFILIQRNPPDPPAPAHYQPMMGPEPDELLKVG